MRTADRPPSTRQLLGAIAVSLGLLAGCATAPHSGAPAGTALVQVDAVLRGADAALPVQLAVQPAQVRIGDPVHLLLSAGKPGYVYLYQLDADGAGVVQVFPNAVDGANYTPGGTLALPRLTWRLTSRGPAGQGYFVAVVAPSAMDLNQVAQAVAQGRIPLPARYGAAMSTLREVAP